jgi:hypothetical protein
MLMAQPASHTHQEDESLPYDGSEHHEQNGRRFHVGRHR